MPKSRKPPRPAKAPELPAALKPYVGKHPADLILELYEAQARKLLTAEGLPVDLAELVQWHDPPKDRKQRATLKRRRRILTGWPWRHFPE